MLQAVAAGQLIGTWYKVPVESALHHQSLEHIPEMGVARKFPFPEKRRSDLAGAWLEKRLEHQLAPACLTSEGILLSCSLLPLPLLSASVTSASSVVASTSLGATFVRAIFGWFLVG